MSDALPKTGDEPANNQPQSAPRGPRRVLRFLGVLLIALSLLTGIYLAVAYLGWQSGQTLLEEKQAEQLQTQATRQIDLARENIAQGSYQLAVRRLEWVLARAPGDTDARALLEQAQTALNVTPSPVVAETPTPTPLPLPTPTPGAISNPDAELQRIQLLIAKQEWANAIAALTAFRLQFPDVERQQTNQLLYDSYVSLGLALVNTEQAELSLYYLAQAEELGDLPQEARDYRTWAQWYLQGMGFYGVNWSVAIGYFRDLCLVAPFYQNACDRLADALTGYADQYAVAQDWCPARELYAEAQLHRNTAALGQKLTAAREGCLAATPTPAAITGTLPITTGGFSLPPLPLPGPIVDDE